MGIHAGRIDHALYRIGLEGDACAVVQDGEDRLHVRDGGIESAILDLRLEDQRHAGVQARYGGLGRFGDNGKIEDLCPSGFVHIS
jgi:hypothetical protein